LGHIRICVAAIVLTFVLAHTQEARGDQISLQAGLAYDFISQEYFFDSLLVDTLDASLVLKTTYLDDIKGRVSLSYLPLQDDRLQLRSIYEHSQDDIRVRFYGDLDTRVGGAKLDIRQELDWRTRYAGLEKPGDSYLFGLLQSRLRVPVSRSLTAWGRIKGDFVVFDTVSAYSYNHGRFGVQLGLTKEFPGFSVLDGFLFAITRKVPDSTALDYASYGASATYFGFYPSGEVDVFSYIEKRDYRLPDGKNDYTRFELDARNKVRLTDRFFTRQELEFELVTFPVEPVYSPDYRKGRLAILGGVEKGLFSIALGPDIEMLREESSDLGGIEDYVEIGGKLMVDFMRAGSLFGSLESYTGVRNLKSESSLQSDFRYERINLIADWNLTRALNFNVLLSAEWEWHDSKAENNNILLLSTGLSYTF